MASLDWHPEKFQKALRDGIAFGMARAADEMRQTMRMAAHNTAMKAAADVAFLPDSFVTSTWETTITFHQPAYNRVLIGSTMDKPWSYLLWLELGTVIYPRRVRMLPIPLNQTAKAVRRKFNETLYDGNFVLMVDGKPHPRGQGIRPNARKDSGLGGNAILHEYHGSLNKFRMSGVGAPLFRLMPSFTIPSIPWCVPTFEAGFPKFQATMGRVLKQHLASVK